MGKMQVEEGVEGSLVEFEIDGMRKQKPIRIMGSVHNQFAVEFVFDFAKQGYRISDYMIVVLQDVHGRRAWTSPINSLTYVEDRQTL